MFLTQRNMVLRQLVALSSQLLMGVADHWFSEML